MLPSRYGWLAREPGPKMIVEALKVYGQLEATGRDHVGRRDIARIKTLHSERSRAASQAK